MNVDMGIVIKNLVGEEMEEGMKKNPQDKPTLRPLTLGIVCIRALTDGIVGEKLDSAEKYKNYKLAMKIEKFDEVNLSAEEVSNLKKRISDMYPAIIMGRAWDLLDPKDDEESKGD